MALAGHTSTNGNGYVTAMKGSLNGSTADGLSPDIVVKAGGISAYGKALRNREITVEAAALGYLERIAKLKDPLNCFDYVAPEDAVISQARALDSMLSSGIDLGPLMGVPIAVKDILAVEGMPTTNGSLHDSADLTGPEGPFVQSLKKAGCLILGKVKTTEWAFSNSGINEATGTPVNPHGGKKPADLRCPGGSSSGSGVAVAAGLCAFSIGSDTGGSVRCPSHYNGVVGHKTTKGLYPTDGVFSLSSTLDTLGPLCASVSDAIQVHSVLSCGGKPLVPAQLKGLKLGLPKELLSLPDVEPAIREAFDAACAKLRDAGCILEEVELRDHGLNLVDDLDLMMPIMASECLSQFGPPPYKRFKAAQPKMDKVCGDRVAAAMDISAAQYATALRKHRELVKLGREAFEKTGYDAWISPTAHVVAPTVEEFGTPEGKIKGKPTPHRCFVNLQGLCALSIPQSTSVGLPAGFQIVCRGGADAQLLAIGEEVERVLPPKPLPQLGKFL